MRTREEYIKITTKMWKKPQYRAKQMKHPWRLNPWSDGLRRKIAK